MSSWLTNRQINWPETSMLSDKYDSGNNLNLSEQVMDDIRKRNNFRSSFDPSPLLPTQEPDSLLLAALKPMSAISPYLTQLDSQTSNQQAPQKTTEPISSVPSRSPTSVPGVIPGMSQSPEYAYEKQFADLLKTRAGSIDEYKKSLEQELNNKPTGWENANFKPLMAIADSINGTHISDSYSAPTAKKDWEAKIQKLQAAIGDSQNKLSDDQLGYLKNKASEEAQNRRLALTLAAQGKANDRSALNNEFRLRNEWDGDPITKNTKIVSEGLGKIQAGYKTNDPASYLTMIYGLMKMQDPGSSVKEGEFQTGENIGGWPEKWRAAYMNARGQGRITQTQKDAIMSQAQAIYDAQMERQNVLNLKYTDIANQYGLNPGRVVLSDIFKSEKTGIRDINAPKVGDIVDGHAFLGGDPSSPQSWKVVK